MSIGLIVGPDKSDDPLDQRCSYQHSRQFPSVWGFSPDIRKAGGGVELLRTINMSLIEAMGSDLHGSAAGNRKDPNALLIEGSVIFGLFSAPRFKGFNVPVMTLQACGGVEELKIRTGASTELGNVAALWASNRRRSAAPAGTATD